MNRRKFIADATKYAVGTTLGAQLIAKNLHAEGRSVDHISSMHLLGDRVVYSNVTSKVKLNGQDVKIHGLSTGLVAVKQNFTEKKGPGFISKLNILFDGDYTEYLPIWVWVIEHPSGIIAIDTGEISEVMNVEKYLSKESAYSRYLSKHTSKFKVEKEDELNSQLDKVGLHPKDIDLVVLTHLHLDHTDGLKFFPNSEIIVGELEHKHPYSNLPSTYPSWFKPKLIDYQKDTLAHFDGSYPITPAADVLYIPTPGHTHGHSSVIFRTDEFDIFFAGDASYNQRAVLENKLAGVNINFKKTAKSYSQILAHAASRQTIYLPTHDPESADRLINRRFLI